MCHLNAAASHRRVKRVTPANSKRSGMMVFSLTIACPFLLLLFFFKLHKRILAFTLELPSRHYFNTNSRGDADMYIHNS